MIKRLVPALFTCGPLLLILAAWVKIYRERPLPRPIGLAALAFATTNAALASGAFLKSVLRTSPWLPPWQDSGTLILAMLFLLAPIGMAFGLLAGVGGTPRWLVVVAEISEASLFIV